MNEPSQQRTTTKSLPPISQLLTDSFTIFKKSFLPLLILTIISWVAIGVLVFIAIIGLISVGIFGFMQANSHTAVNAVAGLQPITIIVGLLLFFLLIVGIVLISSVMEIAYIVVLDGQEDGFAFGDTFKKSIHLIIPAGIVLLFASFIATGGFFLFVLPGLIFSILLSFALYEVILEEKHGNEALRRSIGIVSVHFWGIVGRVVCLWLITMGVMHLAPLLLTQVFPKAQWLIGSISYVVNIFFAWYALSYSITMYKQAKATVSPTAMGSVKWFYVAAIVGWILSILIGVSLVYMVTQFISSAKNQLFLQQQIEQQIKKNNLMPKGSSESTIYNYNNMKEFK